MNLNINILNIIFLLSSLVSLFFSGLFILKKKNLSVIFLSLILLINSLLMVNVFLIDSKIIFKNQNLLFIPLQIMLALGPLIYLYTKSMIIKEFKFKIKYLLLFIPALLEFVYYLTLFSLNTQEKLSFFNKYHDFIISPIEQALGIIYTVIFLTISLKLLVKYEKFVNNNFSNKTQVTLAWLTKLLIVYSTIWIFWSIISVVDYFIFNWELNYHIYYPIYILFSIFTILIFVYAFNKKHSILAVETDIVIQTIETVDLLTDENLELIYKLKKLMIDDKLYLDSNLKIITLANKLNIPSHKLSNLLNSGLKKSFYDFVNYYRVEHVKNMLLNKKYDHLTILAIALESGFNSKSTFNDIFKKITKTTPKEFKKANKKANYS